MKILVIGGGGREHALVWKLRQSPRVDTIFCVPGNAGIAQLAACAPLNVSDHAGLLKFARDEKVDFTVVGPDDPLAAGLVDFFESNGQRIFGPRRDAAKLEWSKVFGKDFMQRHGIPTARSNSFSDSDAAHRFCQRMKYPVVVKADGLALGKGVVVAPTPWSAAMAIHQIMETRKFGEAGKQVLIEEFLEGEECSIHLLCDGKNVVLFPGAQDHKRAFDHDEGSNTGGMGAFSPAAKLLTRQMEERVRREIIEPFLAGLRHDGLDFRGMLFPGIICTAEGPKVLEFNCRFGDPETQVLVTRLRSDLLALLEATVDGRLAEVRPDWSGDSAVCVVLASKGYPGKYEVSKPISGLDDLPADVTVFHAGTRRENGHIVTAGGRVLGVTALGADLETARAKAYAAVERIAFEGCHFRRDIAAKGLKT